MKISFPHLGNYCVPITRLLRLLFPDAEIIKAPPITRKTVELGTLNSPDFVCMPFKYNMGNFIQALDMGADVLFVAGGGCRYGYYSELQEQILADLGYKFKMVSLVGSKVSIAQIYKTCVSLGCKLSFFKFSYHALLVIKIIEAMDTIDFKARQIVGFQKKENSVESTVKAFLDSIETISTFAQLNRQKKACLQKLAQIELRVFQNPLKIGILGELYSLMEPFANYFLEKELAKHNALIMRYTNVTYLLFKKDRALKQHVRQSKDYIKYTLGADGTESVSHFKNLAKNGFDGIIHIKPFGCMPEVNAMPVLMNISRDYKVPVLFFSFDSQTSETGVKTRLEAFCDMLEIKKEQTQLSGESADKFYKKAN